MPFFPALHHLASLTAARPLRLRSCSGRRIASVAAFLVVAAAMLVHAQVYVRFVSDDALISLRYARNLVDGSGLTWTPGERVEGYTDLLWVLLAGAGGCLGFDYLSVSLFLDHIGVIAAIVFLGVSPRTGRWSPARLLSGGALFAASVPAAVWANGGLEHGFMLGVLAMAIFCVDARRGTPSVWTGLPLAALVLLRADGVVLIFLIVLGAALSRASKGTFRTSASALGDARRWATVAALPMCALLGQLVFRRFYYRAWVPNTARAKIAFNTDRLVQGIDYAQRGHAALGVLWGVVTAAALWELRARSRAPLLLPATVVAGWTGYLVIVGGDIFPGWRQLIFVLPPMCAVVAELGERFAAQSRAKGQARVRFAGILSVTLAAASLHVWWQRKDSENDRARTELWEWAGLPVGAVLKAAFAEQKPLLAVDAAGALPYWSELPSLDMLGLNDAYLAQHPPPTFGHGELGHELGDGNYVFARKPDIVAFNNAAGSRDPLFRSGRELLGLKEFNEQYQFIRVRGIGEMGAVGELWIRREGGPLGMRRSANAIAVPAHFLSSESSSTVAELGASGRLVVAVSRARYGVVPELRLPAGHWRVDVESLDAGPLTVAFRCGSGRTDWVPGASRTVETNGADLVTVIVAPALERAEAVVVENVVLTRVDDTVPAVRCAGAGEAVGTSLALLTAYRPEGLPWSHPANVAVGPLGLVATVKTPAVVHGVTLVADNDDTYDVTIKRQGSPLWHGVAGPVSNGGGLAKRHLDMEKAVRIQSGDEVSVVPVAGDGRYSVGQLVLDGQ